MYYNRTKVRSEL